RLHRAHGGAGRRRVPRRLEPLRDARDVSVVRRGRPALLRLDDLPGRRGGGPPRGPLPAAPARRSLRAGDAAAGRAARHARRRRLRRRAAGRGHCDLPDRATPGHRRARDLDGLVLRRAARGWGADDPLRAAAPLEARARAMILVSLVFLLLLLIGVPVAVTVGVAGYVGALLASPAPLATSVQTILHQVDSFVLLSLPLFVLAGALMETGGIARRLVALAVALVGWIRGGLGMAVIIFGAFLVGIMTPTEASVLAVLYAAIVGLFVYREIKWRDLPEIVVKSAMVTGAVGLLLGTAGLVSWFLTVQQMPATLIRLMTVVPGRSTVFLFATAVIFVFFSAVVEGLPAVVILLPSLLPVAAGLGIDAIHYAIVIVAAVGIGLFLPPIGVGLFIACGIADLSVDRASRAMLPFVAVLAVGLVVIILVPWITLVLPRMFKLL